ncbi:13990_t:CDS:2 [Acaulospora morrowiae]|uniref:13990_t:CDS:1 n=1 Tax=Acaulospora morrowiae TaxID=94023 RepID=A0A9N9D6L5_9GLOM|nr:13990_t:CDS:2 [Acaulospora morrowiae]
MKGEILSRSEECIKDLPVAPTAKNSIPNVYYCEWQSEEENDMNAYIAGGTIPAKRGRPKCKLESSLGRLNHIPKIRRAANPVKLIEMNIQPIEEKLPKLYLKYQDQSTEIPISHNDMTFLQTPEEMDKSNEDPNTCDEFEYESEELEKKEEYYMEEWSDGELYENPWENMQSPAIYMTTLEKIPTYDEDHNKC